MIKIQLTRVLAERNLTQRQFAGIAGIRPNAVNALCNVDNPATKSRLQRIDLDILNRICHALNIQPGDLIEYIPDERADFVSTNGTNVFNNKKD